MSKVVKAVAAVGFIALGVFTGGIAFLPGTALAFTVGASTFLAVGIGLASSLILPELAGRPRRNASTAQLQIGEQPRQAILGRSAVGGTLVDAFNYGGKYGTDWEVQVIALADHRCDALEGFFVDDRYVAFAGDGNVAGFNSQLQVFWRSGTWDQTVPSILTSNGPGWTANDRGRGVAYVVVAYKADKSDAKNPVWPSGRPRFRWVVRGLRCYDPRKDSTAGGSGAHRWTDPATWEWSENPIVARYNWVRGIYAGDQVTEPGMLLVGRGLSTIEAPPANVFARANLCDEQVNGAPRYRIGGVVASIEPYIDVENDIAAACAGTISQPEGAVEVDPGEAKAPVAHFTDGDLIVGSEVRLSEFLSAGSDEWVNTVVANFVDPAQRWAQRSAPARRDLADIIADGGPREQQLRLELVTNGPQAGRVAEIARRFGRLWRRGQVTLPPRFAFIEEGDWVTWQSDRHFSGATFTFRVDAWGSDEGWRHQLTLRQISASVFSDAAPLDDGSIANDQPPPPVVAAPAVGTWAAAAVFQDAGGVKVPALRVTGLADDPAAQFVVFEYVQQAAAPDAGTVWNFASTSRPDVTRLDIPMPAGGTFWAAVSYVVDGILGDRRTIGPIAVGELAYSDGTPIEDAFDQLSADAAQAQADATAANASAFAANTAISVITSDSFLSRDEKPEIRKQLDSIIGEYPTIRARGVALGVAVGNYDADYTALINYLGGLALGSATDTAITRITFNTFFTDYYAERQTVLDGIADEASKRASGLPLGNANRVPFSRMEGNRGWLLQFNGAGLAATTDYGINSEAMRFFRVLATATAAGQIISLGTAPSGLTAFRLNPGERLSVQMRVEASGSASQGWFVGLFGIRADGSQVSIPATSGITSGGPRQIINGFIQFFVDVPSDVIGGRIELYQQSSGAGSLQLIISEPMITSAAASQTVHPPFTPGPNASDGADPNNLITIDAGSGVISGIGTANIPVNNALVPLGNANRVPYSRFEGGRGWAVLSSSFASVSSIFSATDNGLIFIAIDATASALDQNVFLGNGVRFPVIPEERLSVSSTFRISAEGGPAANFWRFDIEWFNAVGTSLGVSAIATGSGAAINLYRAAFVTVPANAQSARLSLRAESAGAGTLTLRMASPMVSSAAASQTVHPPFSPGPNADDGADITATVTGPAEIVLDYTSTDTLVTPLPATGTFVLAQAGVGPLTSGVSWTVSVISGAFTGAAPSIVGSGSAELRANSGLSTAEATLRVSAAIGGRTYPPFDTKVRKNVLPATSSGGGGGGSTNIVSDNTLTSVGTSGSFASVSDDLTITLPSGVTEVTLTAASLTLRVASTLPEGATNSEFKWQRESNPGVWSDVGGIASSSPSPTVTDSVEFGVRNVAGSVTCNRTASGLTAGSTQKFRLVGRFVSGNAKTTTVNGTVSAQT